MSSDSEILNPEAVGSDRGLVRLLEGAPIYFQPWWLEAVAPGQSRYVVTRRGGEPAAVMPVVMRKGLFGKRVIDMPPCTQVLGPWLRQSNAKYSKQLADQKALMTDLIGALPSYTEFHQRFHRGVSNWLPFYWQGFTQSTRYSYVVEDLTDLSRVWDGFAKSVRSTIRKAEKLVTVEEDTDLERFLRINELTFRRQGQQLPYEASLIERLDSACAEHSARKMLFAVDSQGRTHAATYFVFNETTTIYLFSGGDPELRSSGANALIVWRGLEYASSVSREFDFEGSMIEPIEHFFRSFGARQCPYFEVRRADKVATRRLVSAVAGSVKRIVRSWSRH